MDIAYQYLTFFLEDDEKLAQIKEVTLEFIILSCYKALSGIGYI